MMYNESNLSQSKDYGLQSYVTRTFTQMFLGLGITAIVAYFGYRNILSHGLMYRVMVNGGFSLSLIALFVQIAICVSLSRSVSEMRPAKAKGMFYVYSAITGITFSFLPLGFGAATVFQAFAMAAVMFGSCAVIGATTKTDLTKFSGILMGGLIALVLSAVLGIWFPIFNGTAISFMGVFIFLGLTAYDMQKIKSFYYQSNGYGEVAESLSVFAAFSLYLDFLNIFMYVLRIMGNSNDR